jgi:hypothetical protein
MNIVISNLNIDLPSNVTLIFRNDNCSTNLGTFGIISRLIIVKLLLIDLLLLVGLRDNWIRIRTIVVMVGIITLNVRVVIMIMTMGMGMGLRMGLVI